MRRSVDGGDDGAETRRPGDRMVARNAGPRKRLRRKKRIIVNRRGI
jgi:hypothetical protein